MSSFKKYKKISFAAGILTLLIVPVATILLVNRGYKSTTPNQTLASTVTLTQPRVLRVLQISYLMNSADSSTVTAVSNNFKQSIVDASNKTGSPAITGVNIVHNVNRTGPRPAAANWQAGLQSILNQDNLCQKIIDLKVDQVWIWVDPDRDTVSGFNQEYAISSDKMPGGTGNLVNLCNSPRSFTVLGLQYTLPAEYAMHSLGHLMEVYISSLQGEDLFWSKWSGSGHSQTTATTCGNVHFPPNGTSDYDYENSRTVSSRCNNWTPEGNGAATNITCSTWGCTQAGYLKWWFQRMPQASQNLSYNGKRIPTWFDFLIDLENAITYYVKNDYWIRPHFAQFVTPDAVQKVTTAKQQNHASSLSFSHTTSGSNKLVLVMASYRAANQSSDDKITSGTYAGTPLTYVRRNQKGEYTTEIWYAKGSLANSGTVVVNFGGNVQDKVVTALSFSDIDQNSPFQNASGSEAGTANYSGGSGNRTVSISVPSANEQIVVGVLSVFNGNDNQITLNGPAQVVYSQNTDNVLAGGGLRVSSSSSTTLAWQMNVDWPWSISAVSLRKVSNTNPPTSNPTITPSPTPTPTPNITPSPTPLGTIPGVTVLSAPANNAYLNNYTPKFTWKKPTGAVSYQLQVADNPSFSNPQINTTVTALTFTPSTSLAGGKTYYWRVQAINKNTTPGLWSNTFTFFLIPNTVLSLTSPTNGIVMDTLRPTFDWVDVPGATSYSFQVSKATSFSTLVVNKTSPTSDIALPTDLAKNTTYYWRVRPKFGSLNGTFSNVSTFVSASPPNVPAPKLPAKGSVLNLTTSQTDNVLRPRLNWTTADNASTADPVSYQIQVSTSNTFDTTVVDKSVPGTIDAGNTATSLKRYWNIDLNLQYATTYYWRVRAKSSQGHLSNWSAVFSFKTPIAAPQTLSSPSNNSTPNSLRPTFKWSGVPGAKSYSIYIKYGTAAETLLATTKAATAQVPSPTEYEPTADLKRNTIVTWRVRANSDSFGNAFSASSVFNAPNPPNTSVLAKPATGASVATVTPTLQWSTTYSTAIPQPDSYDIQISTNSNFSALVVQKSVSGSQLSVTTTKDTRTWVVDTNLSNKTTYYWRVRSKKSGQLGNWSKTFNFKTK